MTPDTVRRWRWPVIAAVIALAVGLLSYWGFGSSRPSAQFLTSPVERGPISSLVAASGTVREGKSIEVRAEVGGEVIEVAVTFNASVKDGEKLARISNKSGSSKLAIARADLEIAKTNAKIAESQMQGGRLKAETARADLEAAQAGLRRAQQALDDAQRQVKLKTELQKGGDVPLADLDQARSALRLAEADLQAARARQTSAEASLESTKIDKTVSEANATNVQATINARQAALDDVQREAEAAVIRSPIDGVILERAIEVGQTVRPGDLLFVVGENRSDLTVNARVDEADISRVAVGQSATLTFDALAGEVVQGRVVEIRKNAQNTQGVITYIVVISTEGAPRLLPGMTAQVQIVTASRDNTLRIDRSALTFTPPGIDAAAVPANSERVWRLNSEGRPRPILVKTGLKDAVHAEVVEGDLQAGNRLIVGVSQKR